VTEEAFEGRITTRQRRCS
jgi:hypothetical protein